MSGILMLIPILLPVLCGALLPLLDFERRRARELYVMAAVLASSACALFAALRLQGSGLVVYHLTSTIDIALRADRFGSVFVLLVSVLWPLATLYAFEYMQPVSGKNRFFCFFTMSFGVTLGVAFSANLITMYLFYEILTLVTLPLITHEDTKEARVAGVKYLVYSIAGATAAFIGIIVILVNGGSLEFNVIGLGEALSVQSAQIFDIAFMFMFFGFGVKSALWPLHGWLPTVGVAPTPVTALLHAVAVVKSGVFAIARVAYFTYGAEYLAGSVCRKAALAFAAFTVVYGTVMAWKEMHFKKRLAYSTVSNLSYMVLAFMLMTPQGLAAGLLHMLFHGIIKIALFFVSGAVLHRSGKVYVNEFGGLGGAMPVSFGVLTAAALALTGVPPLCGFISKYAIAEAAVAAGDFYAWAGIAALLLSSVFTAAYLFTVVIRAYFPGPGFERNGIAEVREANAYMLVPMVMLAALSVLAGLAPGGITDFIEGAVPQAFPGIYEGF